MKHSQEKNEISVESVREGEEIKSEEAKNTFALFENEDFEIEQTDEDLELSSEQESEKDAKADEGFEKEIEDDDEEEEENEEEEEEEENEGDKDTDNEHEETTGNRKKKWINEKEGIHYDNIAIYKNGKVLQNEEIEDRMKYLLMFLEKMEQSNKKQKNVSKSEIKKELLMYYMYYYEYSKDMIHYLNYLFDVKELYLFLEINNFPKDIHLRTNTLKIGRSNLLKLLKNQNVSAEEGDEWNDVDIVVNDIETNVGSLNEYLYGYYMIQSASSFIPALELDVQPNDIVLDMCAAPGGKCTFLSSLKMNKGIVFANDINRIRCKVIQAHASRMGITNMIVTNFDSLKLQNQLTLHFDRILLDAPCTGTGVVNKNKMARRKSIKEIRNIAQMQKKLLFNAIEMLRNGGTVVYSTCSITVEENEAVINYILKRRDVNIVPLNIQIGDEGITSYKKKQFSNKIKMCRRIYLHKHNYDNFFIAKLVKRSNTVFPKKGTANVETNNKEQNQNQNQNQNQKKKNKKKKKNLSQNNDNKGSNGNQGEEQERTKSSNSQNNKNKYFKRKNNKGNKQNGENRKNQNKIIKNKKNFNIQNKKIQKKKKN